MVDLTPIAHLLSQSSDDLTRCASDYAAGFFQLPRAVVYPTCIEDVQQVLRLANHQHIPIVSRGAGTSTTGAAVPVPNALVLNFEKMNRILELDVLNQVAVVQPGVVTGELHKAVEKKGLFYPPDPASLTTCTLGGNVMQNAGGPRALKYGVTRQYVLGLEGVWANGTTFKLGGKLHKNVAGYDLIGLLVGSEGTLGVVTSITLKLISKPAMVWDVAVDFESLQAAIAFLVHCRQAGVSPATAEVMDARCLAAAAHYLQVACPQAHARVLLQLEGSTVSDLQAQVEVLNKEAVALTVACTPSQKRQLWALRRAVSLAFKAKSPHKVSHDVVVPIGQLPQLFAYLHSLEKKYGCTVVGYGHLGDGNVHVNLLESAQNWAVLQTQLSEALLCFVLELGGSITGEHGIGLSKKNYLPWMVSQQELALMKAIKQAVDPNQILNPGKIF